MALEVFILGTFIGLAALEGGVAIGDSVQSNFTIWSLAHGAWGCVYHQATPAQMAAVNGPIPFTAPGYPILASLISFVIRLGHGVHFPSHAALANGCVNGIPAMTKWSIASGAAHATLDVGYVAYGIFAFGLLLTLRAFSRTNRPLPLLGVLILTLCPTVHNVITEYFHPEDLLAVGLVFMGIVQVVRRRWLLGGVLVGLAATCHQSALLAIAALIFLIPKYSRGRFVVGVALTFVLVDVPVLILSNGRALRAIVYGSSRIAASANHHLSSAGGTVLYELHSSGILLFVLTRAAPLVGAALLGWWARRVLGDEVLQPTTLISIIATALTLRLVFEENLFSYYFMPLAAGVVLVDLTNERIRSALLAWLAVATLAFGILPTVVYATALKTGYGSVALALATFLALLAVVIVRVVRGQTHYLLLVALIFVTLLTALPDLLHFRLGETYVPRWFWQILLVPSGLALLTTPWWVAAQRERGRSAELNFAFLRRRRAYVAKRL